MKQRSARFLTRLTFALTLGAAALLVPAVTSGEAEAAAAALPDTAYQFTFEGLTTDSVPLSSFGGKVILVVNTASKCGFTPQYAGLQKLYDTYRTRGLVIVGVPSNDFGGQEPGTSTQIRQFCRANYGVTFPMTAKYDVVGAHAHPFYQWAAAKLGPSAEPRWNFHKILLDRAGHPIGAFASSITPEQLQPQIEAALQAR